VLCEEKINAFKQNQSNLVEINRRAMHNWWRREKERTKKNQTTTVDMSHRLFDPSQKKMHDSILIQLADYMRDDKMRAVLVLLLGREHVFDPKKSDVWIAHHISAEPHGAYLAQCPWDAMISIVMLIIRKWMNIMLA
jgi:hypothetical protein